MLFLAVSAAYDAHQSLTNSTTQQRLARTIQSNTKMHHFLSMNMFSQISVDVPSAMLQQKPGITSQTQSKTHLSSAHLKLAGSGVVVECPTWDQRILGSIPWQCQK